VLSDDDVRALIRGMAAAMMRQNDAEVASYFADEALMVAPSARLSGKQAIFDAGRQFNLHFTNIRIDVMDVFFCAGKGAVEWRFAETRRSDGWTHVMEDAIVFHLREDGKVIYWREYFDPAQVHPV
jgi:uncharacterized protein (TIGR02246 family)